jgi:hypothetical protein
MNTPRIAPLKKREAAYPRPHGDGIRLAAQGDGAVARHRVRGSDMNCFPQLPRGSCGVPQRIAGREGLQKIEIHFS